MKKGDVFSFLLTGMKSHEIWRARSSRSARTIRTWVAYVIWQEIRKCGDWLPVIVAVSRDWWCAVSYWFQTPGVSLHMHLHPYSSRHPNITPRHLFDTRVQYQSIMQQGGLNQVSGTFACPENYWRSSQNQYLSRGEISDLYS